LLPAPGVAPPPDVPLPPALLLLTLHGDKNGAGDADNALRRFRLSGGRAASGRAALRAEPLAPVSLVAAHSTTTAATTKAAKAAAAAAQRGDLFYPRGMALWRGDTLLVASAGGGAASNASSSSEMSSGGGAPAVLAASSAAVCAAGGGLSGAAPRPPPPPPPLKAAAAAEAEAAAKKDAKNEKLSVPSRVFAADGLDHPYGVAVCAAEGRVMVSNQGSGAVTAYAAPPPPLPANGIASPLPPLPLPLAEVFARHGDGRAANASSSADIEDDDDDDDDKERSGSGSGKNAGGATSPLRGVACAPDGTLYVAAKAHNTVYAHAPNGTLLASIPVAAPIALLWDPSRNGLFIGSDRKLTVHVSFYDAAAKRIAAVFSHRDGGGHAAGLALHGGALLVLGQSAGALYQFDVASGALVGTLATGLRRPQALLLYTGPCAAL
jgi:DNA-binding beta-propeller fold protein YncE